MPSALGLVHGFKGHRSLSFLTVFVFGIVFLFVFVLVFVDVFFLLGAVPSSNVSDVTGLWDCSFNVSPVA